MNISNFEETTTIQFNFQEWREHFLREILYVLAAIGLVAVILYVITSVNTIYNVAAGILYFIFLLFIFIKLPHGIRAGFFLTILYAVALSALLDTAAISAGSLFFLGWITLSVLILSPIAGWITSGISLLTIAVVGWLFISGYISPWTETAPIGSTSDWIQACAYILILAITIVRGITLLQQGFIRAQQKADSALQDLRTEQTGLTTRISEATADLKLRTMELEMTNRSNARRAEQFEAISHVLSSVASLRSLEKLLPRLSESISEQYGFYHVGVFLNDSENQYAILRAANSAGGIRMLARDHRLKIGEQGMVGYVTQTGLPRIALDVGEDSVYFDNPDLPDTRSEMTLPLKIGGQVIGALDIQSTEPSAFKDEDIRILSALANQVSLAIDNARLFEQTNRSLDEAESLSRQYLREGWSRLAVEEKISGFRYTKRGTLLLAKEGDISNKPDLHMIEVPILLRGEHIGSLIIHPTKENSLSADQMDIARAVAERVALSAENARLFGEVSRRAERERTVAEITTNIRSSTDPQQMMQAALDELKKALNVTEIEIRPYKSERVSAEKPHRTTQGKKQKQPGLNSEIQ
jgi:GAF domain-containing protein